MEKFEVIRSKTDIQEKEYIETCYEKIVCWERQYMAVSKVASENRSVFEEIPQDILSKLVFCAVKYILAVVDYRNALSDQDMKNIEAWFNFTSVRTWFDFLNGLLGLMGRMTLKNFVTTFPVTKDYDGETWGCKDYFTTMELLEQYDMDKPIGEDKMFKFLYDYQNEYLHRIMILKMCCTSELFKMETGRDMVVEFMEDMADPHHSVNHEKGYQINNMTGEIRKIPKKYKFEPIT